MYEQQDGAPTGSTAGKLGSMGAVGDRATNGSPAQRDGGGGARDAETGETHGGAMSIYSLWTPRQKAVTMLVCATSFFLVPISDTIYLPALAAIEADLHTTASMTAASVAVYMYAVGLGALLFGPAADRFGRKLTLVACTALFTGTSVACMLAPSISVLVAFRALQGFVVSACSTTSNAIMADIYAPAERGRAMGIAAIPFLVGPVAGPLLGGGLAQALGWRSTFAALAIAGGVMALVQLVVLRETHHFFAAQRAKAAGGGAAAEFAEPIHPPHFAAPYKPLIYLLDVQVLPYAAVSVLLFSTMFAALIVLPIVLPQAPYYMGEALVGVATGVPFGVGGFLAAPLGGLMADRCARRFAWAPSGRLVYATATAAALFPAAVLLFAWGIQQQINVAVPLVGGFFINWCMTSHMPAATSLITIVKQRHAAAAAGGLHTLQFVMAGVFVQVTPIGIKTMGVGPFMTMLSAIAWAAVLGSAGCIWLARRQAGAGGRRGGGDGSGGGRGSVDLGSGGSGSAAGGGAPIKAAPVPGAGAAAAPAAVALSGDAPPGSPLSRRSSVDVALEGLVGVQVA